MVVVAALFAVAEGRERRSLVDISVACGSVAVACGRGAGGFMDGVLSRGFIFFFYFFLNLKLELKSHTPVPRCTMIPFHQPRLYPFPFTFFLIS